MEVIAIAGSVIFFLFQLIFCLKAKSILYKLIPVYMAVAVAVCALLLYLGVFGTFSAGMLGNGHQLLAGICLFLDLFACTGIAFGWGVYLLRNNIIRLNQKNNGEADS